MAERELWPLRSRHKTLEKLDRDRDALLEHYAQMVPAALDDLTPEERHQVYKMLRLRVLAYRDNTLDVSGVFGDSFVSENQHQGWFHTQTISPYTGEITPELRLALHH